MENLEAIERAIPACDRCPRLRGHCQSIAQVRKKEFRDWEYWGRPVPGFGDPAARVWIVGLAPAAHGANRTGRMFTGDSSGNWLYRVLHAHGFANQPESSGRADGLVLKGVYISAAARCAPPDNKPTPSEIKNCEPYLRAEARALSQVRMVVPLGKIAWDTLYRTFHTEPETPHRRAKKTAFGHGQTAQLGPWAVRMSYHPSRQNTNTGRLTWEMWDAVFGEVREDLRK
jgi:uracil-DNA glycosylase